MQKILILGAGQSSTALINYFLDHSEKKQWSVTVGDYNEALARDKVNGRAQAIFFDVNDPESLQKHLPGNALVISMLPVKFHPVIAEFCVEAGIHLATASYVSTEMKALHDRAKEKGAILLNECGLDPGLDHMGAMRILDKLREKGVELKTFESFAGGLLAPGTDEGNPWEYKFTWNPRNVVLAGQGIVKFIQEGKYKYIPYHKLFRRIEMIHIPGYGYFEGYANRDSLKYLDLYNLREVDTIYRGTLRRPGFCRTWDVFVQLGATDDTYEMEGVSSMTHRDFINSFMYYNPHDSVELKLAHYMHLELDGPEMHRLKWSGIFDITPVGLEKGTPAQILEHILKKKWTLRKEDRDMIVMWNKFEYLESGQPREIHATMIAKGTDHTDTAMSKTVGLPLALAASLILDGKIKETGVIIPTLKAIYEPVLKALETLGFDIIEEQIK